MVGNKNTSITLSMMIIILTHLPLQARELVLLFLHNFCKDGCHLLIGAHTHFGTKFLI